MRYHALVLLALALAVGCAILPINAAVAGHPKTNEGGTPSWHPKSARHRARPPSTPRPSASPATSSPNSPPPPPPTPHPSHPSQPPLAPSSSPPSQPPPPHLPVLEAEALKGILKNRRIPIPINAEDADPNNAGTEVVNTAAATAAAAAVAAEGGAPSTRPSSQRGRRRTDLGPGMWRELCLRSASRHALDHGETDSRAYQGERRWGQAKHCTRV